MADVQTLRRLALALPEVVEVSQGERLAFETAAGAFGPKNAKARGIVWSRLHRTHPTSRRAPDPHSVVIPCLTERKEMLIATAPDRFFDDDHYRGYPVVLVRLAAIEENELAHLLYEAWRMRAPKSVQARHTL
jgi:hypothetical protein